MTKKKPLHLHKKDGYPPKEHDEDLILRLASILCTTEEIAHICQCSNDTLERRYMHILKQGRANGRSSLRRKQWEVAQEGNPTMLIWLGKQYLKQKEPPRDEGQDDHVEEIKVTLHPSLIAHAA